MRLKNIFSLAIFLFMASFFGYHIYLASIWVFWGIIILFISAVAYFAYSKFKQTQRSDSFYRHRD